MTNRLQLALHRAVVLLCLFSVAAAADDEGITVTGTGEAQADPDCLEVDISASGSAELTGDAVIKYRDRMRRITEAFKKLNVKQLCLQQRELSIGNAADEQHPRPQVAIVRALRVVVVDIQRMSEDDLLSTLGKVIDAAKDAGVAPEEMQAGTFAVRFALRDAAAVREAACQKAFEHAKEQASRLAKLAGGALGRAVGVADTSASTDHAAVTETIYAIYGRDAEPEPEEQGRIVSSSLKAIPVRVSLRVRFELLESQTETQQAVAEK
jgi:uncharacterized protein YggE